MPYWIVLTQYSTFERLFQEPVLGHIQPSSFPGQPLLCASLYNEEALSYELPHKRHRKIDELDEFRLAHQFMQEDVVTEAGSRISISFFRYNRKDLPA
jgi:hypothetical protein